MVHVAAKARLQSDGCQPGGWVGNRIAEAAGLVRDRKDENGNKLSDADGFKVALSQIAGKRLTFAEVTGKVEETPF